MNIFLTEDEIKIICAVLLKNNITPDLVNVFGSRVNGEPRKYSDLDLSFKITPNLNLALKSKLEEDFENSSLLFKVDVVDYFRCTDSFKKVIDETSVTLTSLL